MVHGYHVILAAYGFWLPNDPRGSWSDFLGKWELVRFGKATKGRDRRELSELSMMELAHREAARTALKYPATSFTGEQARGIARGFATAAERNGYTIWACSILPEHCHLVITRHRYKVEQLANLLNGAATRQLIEENIHPLAAYCPPGKRPPAMWAVREWKTFLDSEIAIDEAIHYVEQNPVKEGKHRQR